MKKYFGLLLVFTLGVIPLVPLFFPGLPITHDGQDHVARIANFYQSLTEGNIVPRWAGNLNWGYGHPILMFLYPFPSYLASLFHFVGFSLIDSLKIVFGVTYILSGLGMYLWIKNIWGEKAAIAASAMYLYAPYRFVDLYVRGAIGEHVAFLFIPFICYFLVKLAKKYSYWHFFGLSTSIAGLILSHNAMAVMFLPVIFLYFLTLTSNGNKKFPLFVLAAGLIGFGLSFFFIFPAFFEGKYTLRDKVTGSFEYRNSFVSLQKFFDFSWSFGGTQLLSKQIGVPIIAAFFVCLAFFSHNKNRMLFFILAGSLIFSLFLMTQASDVIWSNVTLIQKFQFPWRFLSIVVFSGSVLVGMSVASFKTKKSQKILATVFVFLIVLFSMKYIQVNGYLHKSDAYFQDIYYGTTDTGESAPIWSVRFMEKRPVGNAKIIDGIGVIELISKDTIDRKYKLKVESERVRVLENTLYFPNWTVYINGNKTKIEFQDEAYRGLITYYVPKGNHEVEVKFEDTKLRWVANIISIAFVVGIGVFYICSQIRMKK